MAEEDPSKKLPRTAELQKLEQSTAALAEFCPRLWRAIFNGCVREGFTEGQALELVKAYIIGSNGIRVT